MGLLEAGTAVVTSAATTLLVLLTRSHIRARRERRMWRRMEEYAARPYRAGIPTDDRPDFFRRPRFDG